MNNGSFLVYCGTMLLMVTSLAFITQPKAAASDTIMAVWVRGNMGTPLIQRRYVSVYDCRKERDFLISFNKLTSGDKVYITCAREQ